MFNFGKKTTGEDSQCIVEIINNYSEDSSIKKLISPISDEYYLLDEENQVSICISDNEVILSNHVYLYKKSFNLSFTEDLKKQVKEHMEKEMQALKKTLFNNEINLLEKIKGLSEQRKNSLTIKHNLISS
ncbi:hypothetical protein [Algibacter mikhailovii]|uniref:hypothetical protein n=1 Tax=Algibacter mikhailovii TaxID=425498 RepID=UPI002495498B|nr:hypothetical protein [Algibacter mikhailovii]